MLDKAILVSRGGDCEEVKFVRSQGNESDAEANRESFCQALKCWTIFHVETGQEQGMF